MVTYKDVLQHCPTWFLINETFRAACTLKLRLSYPDHDSDSYEPSEEERDPCQGPVLQVPRLPFKV